MRETQIRKTKKTLAHRHKFPDGFLWGAATSAYQVEGDIFNNDWALSDHVPKAGLACDHYHRFEGDFLLAKKLGHNAHRLSLEWSRIEPEPDVFSEEALEHYLRVLRILKKNHFTTFLTLHHFTLPIWAAQGGGWANRELVEEFGQYVTKAVLALGPYTDFWVTINEPNIYADLAYLEAKWPPFRSGFQDAWRVYKNLLAAHNHAYEIIHAYYPQARVGFAQNIADNEVANSTNWFDQQAARIINWLEMGYPYAHTKNDFIGLNHYFHRRLRFRFDPSRGFVEILPAQAPLADNGWEIAPKSLSRVLAKLKPYNLPVYITENGLADAADKNREGFIRDSLKAAVGAIKKGVDLRGYFYWSLLDDFEWEEGYKWRFGLVKADLKTQKRLVRKSARVFAQICKTNSLA